MPTPIENALLPETLGVLYRLHTRFTPGEHITAAQIMDLVATGEGATCVKAKYDRVRRELEQVRAIVRGPLPTGGQGWTVAENPVFRDSDFGALVNNPPKGGCSPTPSPPQENLYAAKPHCAAGATDSPRDTAGPPPAPQAGDTAGEKPRPAKPRRGKSRKLWQLAQQVVATTSCRQPFGPQKILRKAVAAYGVEPEFVVGVIQRMDRMDLPITMATVLPQVEFELQWGAPGEEPPAGAADAAREALDEQLQGRPVHRLTVLVLGAAVEARPGLLATPRLVERVDREVRDFVDGVWVPDPAAVLAGELLGERAGPLADAWVSEVLGAALGEVRGGCDAPGVLLQW